MTDEEYLRRAIEVGNRKAKPYNFGAVVVDTEGQIVAEAVNQVHETNDPTAHAEMLALRAAAGKVGSHNLDNFVMYCSHEPCAMCFVAAAWAKLSQVIYATAASEQELRYELKDLPLDDIAGRLQGRSILAQHMKLEEV
ncbi:MAG TPA: nucleoside deaminase [Candidatus Saccharibacteria bacterium]|nr:nucleoside deaminase [Candidatus Saccharibacteria bacterium]HRK94083.1 nucleoside deaminase [Candidatus Saccharibacteria bacterium]